MKNYRLKSIKKLVGNTFIVEKYQRGYKWGIEEVEYLLKDIYEFDKKTQAFYCLQPIVLKKVGKNTYELIDGQQRLTTIFIIQQCLNNNKLFEIEYNTRPRSALFLNRISKLDVIDLISEKEQAGINQGWGNYIQNFPEDDNIDNYHFFTAFQIIHNWLKSLNEEEKEEFLEKLLNDTKIIWYKINSNLKGEKLFIDFNHGSIELEQAELIKALFILKLKKESNIENRAYKINQFAEEWNQIENQLQDNSFWFFVSNDVSEKKEANRIDLLFDILSEKSKAEKNKLFSYHFYLERFQENEEKIDHWIEVKNLFNLLFEWYMDRSIYHILGLLIYLKFKTIAEVFNEYNKELSNKDEFKVRLKKWLNNKIKFDEPNSRYNLSNLSYHTPIETNRILLIFNIATYQISDFNYKFPFDKLKTQDWSLEHIHAQKSEFFTIVEEIKLWVIDLQKLLSDIQVSIDRNDIVERLDDLENEISQLNNDNLIEPGIKNRMKLLNELIVDKLGLHSIKNLCLLDGPTNSVIGNKNFGEKREKILKIDMEGEVKINDKEIHKTFIPICTKNVFVKYYSKDSKNIQFSFWGDADKNDYEFAIQKMVTNYLN